MGSRRCARARCSRSRSRPRSTRSSNPSCTDSNPRSAVSVSGRSSATLPMFPVDPVLIDQVVSNLLENAVRFSPAGGEVVISVAPWRSAVQVRVADQGPGIAAEDRDRVFEAFTQLGAAAPGCGGGSGLGLAISRAIVLAHGGRIWIEGAPGGGTAVVFELPVRDAAPVQQEVAAREGGRDAGARRRRRAADPTRDADQPRGARLRGAYRRHGGRGRGRGRGGGSRARPARSRPARPGRHRGDPARPVLLRGADHRALGPGSAGRQGRGARCRGRRLRHQALRRGRGARAPPRRPPPQPGRRTVRPGPPFRRARGRRRPTARHGRATRPCT